MYGRKTLRIVPVISSDSDGSYFSEFLGGDPVTPQFQRFMRDYPAAVRAAACGGALNSPYACNNNNISMPKSTQSETSDQYNTRIRRQNACTKRTGIIGLISCFACLFTCF